jgi:hypothetical protein
MAGVDVNAPNTQNPYASSGGGALDTQGRYTFGGITTTGNGSSGSSSASSGADIHSYVAMAIIAAVVVAGALLLFKR